MKNGKLHPIRAVISLFRTSGQSKAIEQRLEAQYKAEARYAAPMPRI